ncbi:MAG: hypothetical protein HC903_09855, partial [Methylacidiphilales bacterium]|nr:hypothetical protein [Candidatus Methylacidiphilales bacterium]
LRTKVSESLQETCGNYLNNFQANRWYVQSQLAYLLMWGMGHWGIGAWGMGHWGMYT